ncbi:DinB family protein [Spirosoma aerolatum]|uniref:DinB family protein n=1 Tax=Spirosoma aerolatum TaxID=1211326 RepID=UPI0009AD9783|nr:DinB family protein [Spirosoma aerolatum]
MKYILLVMLLLAGQWVNAQRSPETSTAQLRQELIDAFNVSEKYSLKICEQMPAEHYNFRSTDSTMTFAEQWRHCCIYTSNQLAGRLGIESPYKTRKLPKVMTKEQIMAEVKSLYEFIRQTIKMLPESKLYEKTDFSNGAIPGWRLIYAMENHIIHHRGQCIVYLRLKGIVPESYYGW